MIARKHRSVKDASLSKEVKEAREALRQKGWSYRKAAPHLEVHWTHIARVLTGRRESRRLLKAIAALPRHHE